MKRLRARARHPATRLAGFALAALVATILTFVLAVSERREPLRCPPGQVQAKARCCGRGQRVNAATCVGSPVSCGEHLARVTGAYPGCVASNTRIFVPPGRLVVGPIDWEAEGSVERKEVTVPGFFIDRLEVTEERWRQCSDANVCPSRSFSEPGRPVRRVSRDQASTFCRFAGGRLPLGEEWMLAAVGPASTRYPWGNSGLACRRAAFGLTQGPCAHGGEGPDLAGSRPEGATPAGVQDMVGNVAEWTAEADGARIARGGSYLSRQPAQLKGWASEKPLTNAAPHVGFRCAYDRDDLSRTAHEATGMSGLNQNTGTHGPDEP